MNINIIDARSIFTKTLVDVYRERPAVTSFLRSFFPTVECDTKEVSIQVQRGTEKVAVDIMRGTEGNRNTFSRSTEKIIVPPYFREYFDATELDFYDKLFGQFNGEINENTFNNWLAAISEKLGVLQDKIERAYELQCSQVLVDGIVTLVNGDNIDFKRKVASKVTVTTKWDNGASDPIGDFITGGTFLRTKGKAQGGVFNTIFGASAYEALLNNTSVKERADIKAYADMLSLREPQRNAVGASLVGRLTTGSFVHNMWVYPEYYTDSNGVDQPYIPAKLVISVPEQPRFKLAFGAVPMIFKDPANAALPAFVTNVQAAYVIGNYIDERTEKHIFDIKSAGIAIPTAVDQIYTMQVLA